MSAIKTPNDELPRPAAKRPRQRPVAHASADTRKVQIKAKAKTKKMTTLAVSWVMVRDKYLDIGPIQRHHAVIDGVPVKDVLVFLNFFQLPRKSLLDGIGISERTLQRNEAGKLSPAHSGAALALLEITDMASRVLGSREDAERWLSQSSLALDGERPLDLLTSAPGIDAVKVLLTRIEYGVYA